MDDPAGGGECPGHALLTCWGRIDCGAGLGTEGHRRRGRCFSPSGGPALDLPFRTRTPGKHSGVRRRFSEPAALWRGQGQWQGGRQGQFHRFPGLVWDPFPPMGWWAVGLGAATVKSENWRELMGALGAVERREVPLRGQRA